MNDLLHALQCLDKIANAAHVINRRNNSNWMQFLWAMAPILLCWCVCWWWCRWVWICTLLL